ncbi:site-2 protease family protein [Psychrobacillus sp. NEAU-3TGS]|uniref:metalloprotease n=1 Tax=Psychrobacillus sp. NEAU-3TGS TaxID=2995412 RepID=UPI002498E4DE|nr:site-2 protease family protein [Psychrobacillus sp. NEAU-3TGS]MDI2588237.1 site-2 protease family protein [Psychrobacillus sp. NEAU-3TGS]
MNKSVYKVHPIMIPFFLFFYLSGEIAIYSIVFGSLLIHEVGHLIAAKIVGVKVRTCTILPYGGEIKMEQFSKVPKSGQLFVIFGGPFCTLLILVFSYFIDFPQDRLIFLTQLIILGLNLLPIYPLDGGRALDALFPDKYEMLIGYSIWISSLIFFISLAYFPRAVSASFIFLFIVLQNITYWRFRKYKLAFDRITKTT